MAVPATPSSFYVQGGNAQVLVSWAITSTATSYKVQRSTDGVSFSTVSTPAVNYYLDTTVTSGTLYYYQVAATNGSGDSSYTTAQSIIPSASSTMALGSIRLAAQQRADRVGSNFVTMPEWNSYINQSYFELYDLLVTLYEDFYVAPALIIPTDGTSTTYALPTGSNYSSAPAFYKLIGVDCGLSNTSNAWVTLKKFDFVSRNRFVFPQMSANYLGTFNLQYRLLGSSIEFIPTPAAGQYLRIWYIPRATQLLQDTDILDGVSGWTEYVIVDAAIKALQKEESDVSVLMAQKMALRQRIEESASNRDAGMPETISDSRGMGWGGPGFDGSFGGY